MKYECKTHMIEKISTVIDDISSNWIKRYDDSICGYVYICECCTVAEKQDYNIVSTRYKCRECGSISPKLDYIRTFGEIL